MSGANVRSGISEGASAPYQPDQKHVAVIKVASDPAVRLGVPLAQRIGAIYDARETVGWAASLVLMYHAYHQQPGYQVVLCVVNSAYRLTASRSRIGLPSRGVAQTLR